MDYEDEKLELKTLAQNINKKKKELNNVIETSLPEYGDVGNPYVLKKSKELDKLIVMYHKLTDRGD